MKPRYTSRHPLIASLLAALVWGQSALAEPEPTPASDPAAIMSHIADLVRDQFVDEAIAHTSAPKLEALANSAEYRAAASPEILAAALTRDLRTITGDSHIGVVYDPAAVSRYRTREQAAENTTAREKDAANKARKAAEAAADNFGIRAVEVMPGGVGYLRIDEFYGQEVESEPVFAAVMTLLAPAEAIILDLRHNGGGNSRILPLFLGYFLGPGPVAFATRHERWRGESTALVTRADMAGARHAGKPLYILTSGLTYSLAEHVTYHLKALTGATVVGERTFGGGNGFDPVVLNDSFYLRLPRLAFTNTRTGTLYREHEGISPDIATNASNAREVAYRAALTHLVADASDPEKRQQAQWALAALPDPDPAQTTTTFEERGTFDDFTFRSSGGEMWLSFRGAPFVKLQPAHGGAWLDDRSVPRLIRFEGGTPAEAIAVTPYQGEEKHIPRSDDR
jgi:hypothetical protein